MILKVSLLLIGVFVAAVLSVSIDCDIEQCAKPSKLYEELGCKAVYGSRSCCAKRFDCPDFKKLDDNQCTFEGKDYKIGEILPRTLASNTKCVETCICTRQNNEPAKFTCKNSDCGISSFNTPGCLNIYGDLNECCSTSIVCDEAEKETLASCFVGREYREGEKFIPESNPCYECLCHKDFDNTTIADNPHCRKLNCGIDLRYKSFVQRGCLPVFHSENCCPVDWECPTKLVKKLIKRSADDEETQTAKLNIFIVTPSKNLEEYLAEVKLANPDSSSEESSTTPSTTTVTSPTTTTEALPKVISTEPTSIPTLSSDPFLLPVEATSASVTVEDETTNALKIEAASVETTQTPTTSTEPLSTTTEAEKESKTSEPLTAPPTIVTTITSTTPEATTSESTTSTPETSTEEKKDSDESKEAEENTNLFGEEVEDKDEKVDETTIPTIAEPSTEESASSTSAETTLTPLTTETIKEAAKVLEQPEELTTLAPETTSVATTPEAVSSSETSEVITVVSTSEAASTTESTSAVLGETHEVTTESDKPAVKEEQTTQAASTVPTTLDNVFPTEFEKLLTTLREFVAQADSLTSTVAPTTSTSEATSKVDQQVEFVNFTVSSETPGEETKSISKRSAEDADLIPTKYKQNLFSSKEKVCVYNGRTFKVGEAIRTDNDCLKCLCEYAPIGHCIMKEKCNHN